MTTLSSSKFPGEPKPRPRLLSSKRNESLKLAAAAFDRISTVVLGGAVLAPIFQHQGIEIGRVASWVAAAFLLHATAQLVLSFLEEETQPVATTVDPTWAVPALCLILAAVGVTWAKLTAVARDRRYGTGSTTPGPQRPARPSQAP